ncbi:LytR/AlgR family response regulator transcription factor [Negadavirga shengliensis]|uniref:LytR/AlgR family response regulator transcription factor n=1 Tax=Negadavirga shengliensis TaxID=1389218 RepID=A0ABV9T776_9BACT
MKTVFQQLSRLLHQPYPLYYLKDRALLLLVALFLFGFLFLYFFEPFVVYPPEHRINYVWICLIHALQPTLIAFIYFYFLEKLTSAYDQWTVGKEFLHISILLLLIGIGSFLIRDVIYHNPFNWSWGYFFEEIRNTFLIGFLILAIFVPLNYIRLLRQHVKEVRNLNFLQPPFPAGSPPSKVFIKTQLNIDDFDLIPEQLILARADGNYMELYVQQGANIQKIIKRMSLKKLEEQLRDFPFILKTHRAYLVNLRKVCNSKGNAQGYQLSLHGFEEVVPVSRSMIPNFKRQVEGL